MNKEKFCYAIYDRYKNKFVYQLKEKNEKGYIYVLTLSNDIRQCMWADKKSVNETAKELNKSFDAIYYNSNIKRERYKNWERKKL